MPPRGAWIFAVASAALLPSCGAANRAATPAAADSTPRVDLRDSPHVRFGVPVDADPSDDYLMDKAAYVLSYNRKLRNPNWVAWRLTAADLGSVSRGDDFRADASLPSDFGRVLPSDYQGSGYDRGHLCPSAHRTSQARANSATFWMSNMIPQAHALNAGPWKGIESHERSLVAKEGKTVYVVAGGLFGANPHLIGAGVTVPRASYRVTIVLDSGSTPADVTAATPVYAVEMPNDSSAKGHPWSDFRVSVDQVERDTGYDFWSALPNDIEELLEKER